MIWNDAEYMFRLSPVTRRAACPADSPRRMGSQTSDCAKEGAADIANARIGSEVELWGPNIPVGDVAASAGTIAYELLCNAKRAPRVTKSRLLEGSRGRTTSWREVVGEGLAFVFVQPRRCSATLRSGRPQKRKLPN